MKFSFLVPITESMKSTIFHNHKMLQDSNLDHEIIIVSDGPYTLPLPQGPNISITEGPQTKMAGNRQRQMAMEMATGDLLVFLDQDVLLTWDGVSALHRADPTHLNLYHITVRLTGRLDHVYKGYFSKQDRGLCGGYLVPPRELALKSWWWREDKPDYHRRDADFAREMIALDPDPKIHPEVLLIWYQDDFQALHATTP